MLTFILLLFIIIPTIIGITNNNDINGR
jgi:hypothetical protein